MLAASDRQVGWDFVSADYLTFYRDLPDDPDFARDHYFRYGRLEGRYPSEKAIAIDRVILLGSDIFDPAFYRVSANLGEAEDPARHYLLHGWRMGLEPGPGFEGSFLAPYFKAVGFHGPPGITYALLRAANWAVYATRAAAEAVAETIRDSGMFDSETYRAFLGLSDQPLDPVLHYVLVGERHGIRPSTAFDPGYYGEQYPDVFHGGICFLSHYLSHGQREGRRALPMSAEFPDDDTNFAPDKETIILVSHEASRTGAPIVALNIGHRLCEKYNLITLLLRGGDLVDSFKAISAQVICFQGGGRLREEVGYVVTSILEKRPIRYAIVNASLDPTSWLASAGPFCRRSRSFTNLLRTRGLSASCARLLAGRLNRCFPPELLPTPSVAIIQRCCGVGFIFCPKGIAGLPPRRTKKPSRSNGSGWRR